MLREIPINSDLSENVEYMNPHFPAHIHKMNLSMFPNYAGVTHWHDDLEFIIILDGHMTYNINGKLVELTRGNGILVNSRQLHYGYSPVRRECTFLCIILHTSLLCVNDWFRSQYVLPLLYNDNLPYLHLQKLIPWQKHMIDLVQDIYDHREDELAPVVIQTDFFEIFREICANVSPADSMTEKSALRLDSLKSMIGYIQLHYMEKITLDQIAHAGNCCKSKCSALFKQYLKQSPNNYLIDYRLSRSVSLLQNTSKSVAQIAEESGFHGASYYCEAFRKHFGISPKEYRQTL